MAAYIPESDVFIFEIFKELCCFITGSESHKVCSGRMHFDLGDLAQLMIHLLSQLDHVLHLHLEELDVFQHAEGKVLHQDAAVEGDEYLAQVVDVLL